MKISISELSQSLSLPVSTIERWMRQGSLPVHKEDGNLCVFNYSILKKWAEKHNLKFVLREEAGEEKEEQDQSSFSIALKRGGVFHNIKGNSIDSVLASAVKNVSGLSESEKEELLDQMIQRENMASTGVGKGIAFPHPRTPCSDIINDSTILICFLENEVDYNSIDDVPVFILFLLLCPDTGNHHHLLSRMAFYVRDNNFVNFLKTKPTSEELFDKIISLEESNDS